MSERQIPLALQIFYNLIYIGWEDTTNGLTCTQSCLQSIEFLDKLFGDCYNNLGRFESNFVKSNYKEFLNMSREQQSKVVNDSVGVNLRFTRLHYLYFFSGMKKLGYDINCECGYADCYCFSQYFASV